MSKPNTIDVAKLRELPRDAGAIIDRN